MKVSSQVVRFEISLTCGITVSKQSPPRMVVECHPFLKTVVDGHLTIKKKYIYIYPYEILVEVVENVSGNFSYKNLYVTD